MAEFFTDENITIYCGDSRDVLKNLSDESVQCVVTSPPYYGLRDYRVGSMQFGLEATPEKYIDRLMQVFDEVRRVLRRDGVMWIVMGDTYASGKGKRKKPVENTSNYHVHLKTENIHPLDRGNRSTLKKSGLKPKDLIGIPWMLAFALRDAGWYLRSDIIWEKPNQMPSSVRDRPTKSHEYIFMLTKSEKYFYDAAAVAEPLASDPRSWGRHSMKDPGLASPDKRPMFGAARRGRNGTEWGNGKTRNRRTVWRIPTVPFKGEFYAAYPPMLVELCVAASSKRGDTVLDPFMGSGTTGMVALDLYRKFIGIDINPRSCEMAGKRIYVDYSCHDAERRKEML